MSSRPSLRYNSINQRWEVHGKGGGLKIAFPDNMPNSITNLMRFVATLSAAVAVPSGAVGVGTLQSATGSGVGCGDLAVGDSVFGVPKVALSSVFLGGFHVPTTDTLNVYVQGAGVNGVGSLAIIGFDCFAIR